MPYAVRVGLLRYYADQAGEAHQQWRDGRPLCAARVATIMRSAAHSCCSSVYPAGKNYEYRLIRRVVRHPNYNGRTTAYDIALL